MRKILGGSADHRGPSNIDILQCLLEAHPFFSNGLNERVEVYRYQVYRLDALLCHLSNMAFQVSSSEDATVYHRVKSLHPAVEDLRESGHLTHATHRHSRFLQCSLGAAGAEYLHTQII